MRGLPRARLKRLFARARERPLFAWPTSFLRYFITNHNARIPFQNFHRRPQHGRRTRAVARHRHEGRRLRKPIIAVVNSFTQFVPGHVHLKDLGQLVAREIEAAGGVAKEFNTIAVDDGIAMGHDGMLYSLPCRDIIADSVEYMVNAHCADAMVCISNCDKITPGMLMAAHAAQHPGGLRVRRTDGSRQGVLGGKQQALDLVDAMVTAADPTDSDADVAEVERSACPTCGSCSGMFTANSMNCLTEALGLSLPGNGTVLATHADREHLFERGRAPHRRTRPPLLRAGRRVVLPRAVALQGASRTR